MAEKSEKATPKKLRDARKKGQVARSQDFPAAFTFVVSIASTLLLSGYLYNLLAGYMMSMFRLSSNPNIDLANTGLAHLTNAAFLIFEATLPIIILTVAVGILVNLIVIGPNFSMEALKPDIKKLNPVTNIKNMFKLKTFVELIKSILKITGALIIIYYVMHANITEIVATAAMPVIGTAQVFSKFLVQVIVRIGIFFLIVAIFDLVFQKRTFAKEMMMEKFEVKQEYKDTEGDPHLKSKRRHTAQEIAYQEGPASVKRARAVITNPEHIAVAVEYDAEKEPAPKVVTMGKGKMADLIIKAAQEYGIPIMRNVPLAHTLFEKSKISEYIPEETYQAVAEILKWLQGLESFETSGTELFKQ